MIVSGDVTYTYADFTEPAWTRRRPPGFPSRRRRRGEPRAEFGVTRR
jgi:hypothetical protein